MRESNWWGSFLFLFIIILVLFTFSHNTIADDDQPTIVPKSVSGKLSFITPSAADPKFIGIRYGERSDEIMLRLNPDGIQVVNRQNLSEFSKGDSVEVVFDEITITKKEKTKIKRIANIVRFVRAAGEDELEEFGLLEDPYVKFRREKILELIEQGVIPPPDKFDLSQQEIRALEEHYMREYKRKGEWPTEAIEHYQNRIKSRKLKSGEEKGSWRSKEKGDD